MDKKNLVENFICPNCAAVGQIEELCKYADFTLEVEEVYDDSHRNDTAVYGGYTIDDYGESAWRCRKCFVFIKDTSGVITSLDRLIWLLQDMGGESEET
jgi:hypothetical protein